jgi:ATP-binding cassette subfamily C (CFTR/MRP) protein 1
MGVLVVTLALQLHGRVNGGLLGIALNAVLSFNQSLQGLITSWTALETSLGAIARLKSFATSLKPEDRPEENFEPNVEWPSHGAIEFNNVSASYGPDLTPVLQNVSVTIAPGEKIGICGRTGSGKSTLLAVLLRLLDLGTGAIIIDNIDLATLPRETIRSRILTVPQEHLVLSGSVRFNLDPISASTDSDIITALTKVHLWSIVESRGGLDSTMQALSQGQHQLFSLARALLRKKGRILLLDEAMSSVDNDTDRLMQDLIRQEFADWTVITIAHRLNTIQDSDRIIVMESGKIVEAGKPADLIRNKRGAFNLLQQGGGSMRL